MYGSNEAATTADRGSAK